MRVGSFGRDHHVPEAVVAVHDGGRERVGDVLGQEAADLVDGGDLARLVDLPQLREAPHLALEVAAGPREVVELRRRVAAWISTSVSTRSMPSA